MRDGRCVIGELYDRSRPRHPHYHPSFAALRWLLANSGLAQSPRLKIAKVALYQASVGI